MASKLQNICALSNENCQQAHAEKCIASASHHEQD